MATVRKVLITGAAGFIGFHTAKKLLNNKEGGGEGSYDEVVGFDNINDYYETSLKEARLEILKGYENFRFIKGDLSDRKLMAELFENENFEKVIHLAAQAGVRYSIEHPEVYVDANLVGFGNILEGCRHSKVKHLVYASSSSVYGANTTMPFSVHHNVDHPISLYAATKKANELMAHTYAHLYRMPVTGLRFFTVYGPWGRPDMALFSFTKAIIEDRPIDVYNHGKMKRDFTYIDDIVEGLVRVLEKTAEPNHNWSSVTPDSATSAAPYRIFNIGNSEPQLLEDFIGAIEDALGKKAQKNYMPIQPGDVLATFADVKSLENAVGFKPKTPLREGVKRFVDWYQEYYGQK